MRRLARFSVAMAFFLLSAPGSPVASQENLPGLFPIQQQGKRGFIDRTGKVIVPPPVYASLGFS